MEGQAVTLPLSETPRTYGRRQRRHHLRHAPDRLLEDRGPVRSISSPRKGVVGVRVDRTEKQVGLSAFGLAWHPDMSTIDGLVRAVDSARPDRRRAALAAYIADPRDPATPAAIGRLLTALSTPGAAPVACRQPIFFDGVMLVPGGPGERRLKAGLPRAGARPPRPARAPCRRRRRRPTTSAS